MLTRGRSESVVFSRQYSRTKQMVYTARPLPRFRGRGIFALRRILSNSSSALQQGTPELLGQLLGSDEPLSPVRVRLQPTPSSLQPPPSSLEPTLHPPGRPPLATMGLAVQETLDPNTMNVEEAFRTFDEDGSGGIDAEELEMALGAAGLRVTSAQSFFMLRQYDGDRSGSLDMSEFRKLVRELRKGATSSLQARLDLRTHERVRGALDDWWTVAVNSLYRESGRASSFRYRSRSREHHGSSGVQLQHEYFVSVMERLFLALNKESYPGEAHEVAEDTWEEDRRGMYARRRRPLPHKAA